MNIRPLTPNDISQLAEIDATIDSSEYVHVTRDGETPNIKFSLEPRPLRERSIQSNRITDDTQFLARQIASGADEGLALVMEHDGQIVGLLLAQTNPTRGVLEIFDLRVDHDFRRQGLGLALMYQAIQFGRDQEMRAIAARTMTDNLPAARMLQKCAFEIGGLDTLYMTNHDLVAESVTLFWYAALN